METPKANPPDETVESTILRAEVHIEQSLANETASNERPPQPSFHIDTAAKAPSAQAVVELPTIAVVDKTKVTPGVTETRGTNAQKKPHEAEPVQNNKIMETGSTDKDPEKAVTTGNEDTKKIARDAVKDTIKGADQEAVKKNATHTVKERAKEVSEDSQKPPAKDHESIQPPTKKAGEQELFFKPQKAESTPVEKKKDAPKQLQEKKHSVPSVDVPVHAEPPKIRQEPLPRQPRQREVITQPHESVQPVITKPVAKEIFVKPHEKPAPQAKNIVKKSEQKKAGGKERHQKPDEPMHITTLSKLQEIVDRLDPSPVLIPPENFKKGKAEKSQGKRVESSIGETDTPVKPAEQKNGKQSENTKKRETKKTAPDKDQKDPTLIAVKDKDKIADNKKARDQEALQPLATKTGGKELFVKPQKEAPRKSDKSQEKLQMKQQKDNTQANNEQKKPRKKRAQESDVTTIPKKQEHGEASAPPTKIVVSEKIMDLIEQVMEQNDKAGDKRQKREKKDTVQKKDENRPSLSVVKDVVRNKEKITLSSQRKSPENDDQKVKKSEVTPVTKVDELKEAFAYIKKLSTHTAPEKKQSKNTTRKEKQKTKQVEVIVSDKLLESLKDAREKLPSVPKKKKQNADGTDPLPVTFTTNKKQGRELTIDRTEVMKLQLLLEKSVSDGKNHDEQSEVLIFNPKKNISKEKNAESKPKQRITKETNNAKKQYVEIASDDKDLLIELEALKNLIKELQALQKKQKKEKNQGNEPITPDLSGLAPEELVQEDAQTQAADDISTLLHYQFLLLLLSLSEKTTYSDEIYTAASPRLLFI